MFLEEPALQAINQSFWGFTPRNLKHIGMTTVKGFRFRGRKRLIDGLTACGFRQQHKDFQGGIFLKFGPPPRKVLGFWRNPHAVSQSVSLGIAAAQPKTFRAGNCQRFCVSRRKSPD